MGYAFVILCAVLSTVSAGMLLWGIHVGWVLFLLTAVPVGLVWLITHQFIFPGWHNPHPDPAKGLNKHIRGRATEWYGGKVTNPLVDFSLPFRDVEWASTDGTESFVLRGWHVPPPTGNALPQQATNAKQTKAQAAEICIVCVHGAGRDRRAWLRHLPILNKAGYGVLVMDCREHGLSHQSGRGVSYGVRETKDVVSAADFAQKQLKYRRVALLGTSQGAVCAILATAARPAIEAVVAENPWTSRMAQWHHILDLVFGRAPQPILHLKQAIINLAVFALSKRLRITADEPDPIDVVGGLARPLLLMHGDNDVIIPVQHSQELFDLAREPKRLWIAKGGEHTGLYNRYPDEWEKQVLGFFNDVLLNHSL